MLSSLAHYSSFGCCNVVDWSREQCSWSILADCQRLSLPQEFFEKHKNNSVIENWTDDNIYVNHEQSRCLLNPVSSLPGGHPVMKCCCSTCLDQILEPLALTDLFDFCRFLLVDLPEIGSMKPTLFELIRPVFEEWIGGIPLVPSAIYGVRIYTEGSILQVRKHYNTLVANFSRLGQCSLAHRTLHFTLAAVRLSTLNTTTGLAIAMVRQACATCLTAGSRRQARHTPGVGHHQRGPGGRRALAAGHVRSQRQAHQGVCCHRALLGIRFETRSDLWSTHCRMVFGVKRRVV